MMTSIQTDLLDGLVRAGFHDRSAAAEASRATVAVLGERLTHDEASRIAESLPEPLRSELSGATYDGEFDAAELFERVRRRSGRSPGRAREEAQLVCAALGRMLPEDDLRMLDRHLPHELARLFHPDPPPSSAQPEAHGDLGAPSGDTLATGRAGSKHPLSEAATSPGQRDSVAREREPHRDTKLSSASGLTQDRIGESLATGRPGSRRPVSEAAPRGATPRRPRRLSRDGGSPR
jgi:uncharacterized protein (DUF2267 family)